jgi:hypothetical protein
VLPFGKKDLELSPYGAPVLFSGTISAKFDNGIQVEKAKGMSGEGEGEAD